MISPSPALPYQLSIAGVDFSPSVPPEAVKRQGGGRPVTERHAIDGTIIITKGHTTARRVQISSPGEQYALSAEQTAHLRALEIDRTPFSVTFGPGYEISGTFTQCVFEGDVRLTPFRNREWVAYEFTLILSE